MPLSPSGNFTGNIDFSLPHILCISGGRDSVFMLHCLSCCLDRFKKPPEIVHFNHGLRKNSCKDEKFVCSLAEKHNLKIKVFKIDVRKFASENSLSLEDAARILRYRRLEEYSSSKKEKGIIFTAHNATDQAETVIFRVISGTGPSGMRAIRRRWQLNSGWILERPVLDITSAEIEKFLKENKIACRTDRTNFDTSIPRNFIRHKVIPLLKKLNPSLEASIARSVDVFTCEDEYLQNQAEQVLSRLNVKEERGKTIIELKDIISYNKPLLRRILRKVSPVELDFEKTAQACGIALADGCSKSIEIGGGWQLRKDYGKLIFEKPTSPAVPFCYILGGDKGLSVPEAAARVTSEIVDGAPDIPEDSSTAVFDARDMDAAGIKIRSRRPGDRIKLMGGGGTRKVKDILIDDKISLEERNRVCVFEYEDNIIWLAPVRRSSHWPVEKNTEKALILKVVYE